ncbi:tryptophan--tRNA ligase [soil metagenome]
MRNWVELQASYDAYFCVVDLHAITLPWEPAGLRRRTIEVAAALLACGIDPTRSVLFIQSHVGEHSELAWVLGCISRMGELRRMVQFKEKSRGESESVGAGVFTYPILQAADVLLYRAHGVPVGEDQRQHIELMRELAGRFNATFGDTFVVPEAWIAPAGARIMALDDPTQKMSKSAGRPASTILLDDPPEAVAGKVKAAVTDSGRDVRAGDDKPALSNLLTILSLTEGVSIEELESRFAGSGYGHFKQELADAVVRRLDPIRVRYEELKSDPAETARLLEIGATRAAEVAATTMDDVRDRIGLMTAARDPVMLAPGPRSTPPA